MTSLTVPALSLVVLIGPSGSGKSTFARTHFRATEVLSSDYLRGVVRDDESDMAASADAFDLLRYIARKRLAAGLLTVVDATNVKADDRAPLIALAREFHALPVAIVFNLDVDICIARNKTRPEREGSQRYVLSQHQSLRRELGRSQRGRLEREGFRYVHLLASESAALEATIERQPIWSDRRGECGPFDCIGDGGLLDEP